MRTLIETYPEACLYNQRGKWDETLRNNCHCLLERILINICHTSGNDRTTLLHIAHTVTSKNNPSFDPSAADYCSRNLSVIQALLREKRRFSNAVNYSIGAFLNKVLREGGGDKTSMILSLCNHAEQEKVKYYQQVLRGCCERQCLSCTQARQFDNEHQRGAPKYPCSMTQALCRLNDLDFENLTPTFLKQVMALAALDKMCQLVTTFEPESSVRATCLDVASSLHDIPSLLTGAVPVFEMKKDASPVEADQYTDGDGGFIVSEYFPLLEEYLKREGQAVPTVHLQRHDYHLIPFRECHHDAIELGHEYRVSYETGDSRDTQHIQMEWGYDALVSARGNLAGATQMWIVPKGPDHDGSRLLLELFILLDGERTPLPTGVRLLEARLSYLVDSSPSLYQQAWETGKRNEAGIHRYDLGSVEQLHPRVLKHTLTHSSPVISIEHNWGDIPITCRVTNVADWLNEGNIWILWSYITGASLSLFLRPTPLTTGVPLIIPRDRTVCLYELQPTRVPLDQIVCTDYLMENTRLQLRFNPDVYDGQNIGRFVNQAGLPEGVKKLCQSLDRRAGSSGFQSGYINDEMDKYCSVQYKVVEKAT